MKHLLFLIALMVFTLFCSKNDTINNEEIETEVIQVSY